MIYVLAFSLNADSIPYIETNFVVKMKLFRSKYEKRKGTIKYSVSEPI